VLASTVVLTQEQGAVLTQEQGAAALLEWNCYLFDRDLEQHEDQSASVASTSRTSLCWFWAAQRHSSSKTLLSLPAAIYYVMDREVTQA
jgi:hypothetical protein